MARTFKNRPAYDLVNSRWRGHHPRPLDLTRPAVPAGRSSVPNEPTNLGLTRQPPSVSGISDAELERVTAASTQAAAETILGVAAERARAAVAEASSEEARVEAVFWAERWLAVDATDIRAEDLAQLEDDVRYQVQWALANSEEVYVPDLDREFLADCQQHSRNWALARIGHQAAFRYESDPARRQLLLEEAWRASPIEPFIDADGQVKLFFSMDEQLEAERLRDAPAPTDVAPAQSEETAVLWRSKPRHSLVVRGLRDIWRRLS